MLPDHKTKLICTIGPASSDVAVLCRMFESGMSIARLNFSHGDPGFHRDTIAKIRDAAHKTGRPVAVMGDLPGPKIRIGEFAGDVVALECGKTFTLTTEDIIGTQDKVSVTFKELPYVVSPGDTLYLNDGFISLVVVDTDARDVHCTVKIGGELHSRKGLNLPGLDLGLSAFTENDRRWLEFAAEEGIDAVSQSFVASEKDIFDLRAAAGAIDYAPLVIAKIERSRALESLESIIDASDAIMVARGDLGVETPIAEIALLQKRIINQARQAGKPVITATQMLESMISNRRPTRAEATDVANAILDGTDSVMLSGESAVGQYPVEATAMLASIARATEEKLPESPIAELLVRCDTIRNRVDLIALAVQTVLEKCRASLLVVPTQSGSTARNVARFRHRVWVQAVTESPSTAAGLLFSFGVFPHLTERMPERWELFIDELAEQMAITGDAPALLTEGPSPGHPEANHRLELIDINRAKRTGSSDHGKMKST